MEQLQIYYYYQNAQRLFGFFDNPSFEETKYNSIMNNNVLYFVGGVG